MAENMREKRKRKKEKIVSWLKKGDSGSVERNASGQIISTKQIYRRIPKETPSGRDAKLSEFSDG